ncbi:MAG TPA: LLM class flavin-dependent oxidoreductase [Candidatus Binatia bacterium]|nr:LLM class flavin-dependent oxidoreductase [Candidatus Binatia bacterium]
MSLVMSCAFATSLATPEHVRIAEELGYARAWLYDSPALYPDVWVQLCRAADRTRRIGLGPGVLVPSLRHPLVNASAIAMLVEAAGPERVAIGIGSGFTGRRAMGRRPIPWAVVSRHVRVLRALLRGEEIEWEGAPIRMLHRDGFAPARPIAVPFVIAAAGPKGIAVARELGDGVFGAPAPVPGFSWSVVLTFGTVLGQGEGPGGARVIDAAGHAGGVLLHWMLEQGRPDLVPRGVEWAAAYDAVPARSRHLALHDGHLCTVNPIDRPFVTGELLAATGAALSPEGWREKLAQLEADGATEVAYQPAGPAVPRELERFARLMRA